MNNDNVLVIDDNEINRDICAINLNTLGVTIYFAENGKEGISVARKVKPDLILLDIMMPEMDGFEVLEIIKSDTDLCHIPILMLTAISDTNSIVKALDLGANDYLKKPFEEEEMVARVKTLLRNRYLENRLVEDMKAGARMQEKFLTDYTTARAICESKQLAVGLFNRPYALISGDFFHFFQQADGKVGLFIGDSCGHGLSAALISMRIIGLLHELSKTDLTPAEILTQLSKDLSGLLPKAKFIAAILLLFEANTVTMCNCGQPYPLLLNESGVTEIVHNCLPIGLNQHHRFEDQKFSYPESTKIILYTDGLIETTDANEEVYGQLRLIKLLETTETRIESELLCKKIIAHINEFSNHSNPEDDQTLLIVDNFRQ